MAPSSSPVPGALDLRHGEVTLVRDRYGTPHLYAAREEDGFYGLGYAYGADRLHQLLVSYLRLQGRLSEVFGRTGYVGAALAAGDVAPEKDGNLRSDLLVRMFDFLPAARANFDRLPLQLQADMQSFIRGLQAYMDAHPEQVPAWAPKLEAAMPIAHLSYMTLGELFRACDAYGKVQAPRIARTGTSANVGSNAWAVAPWRSADGVTLFSSDSHGPFADEDGTSFYNWRMKAGAVDALSFDIAGAASFFFGHSASFAWGWTEGPRNIADCYSVRTVPGQPRTFLVDGKPQSIAAEPYRIAVKGEAPITGEIETTRHNGIRSVVVGRRENDAIVVSSPYLGRIGLAAGEYYAMATARSRAELFDALAQREIYPANLVLGGADGLVMYLRPGRIPVRPAGVQAGTLLDGNKGATSWLGVHEYADLVKLVDPPQGYVANSNISPDRMYPEPVLRPGDYPPYFGFQPGYINQRQLRFLELLPQARRLTVANAIDIAMDETLRSTGKWGAAIRASLPAPRTAGVAHVVASLAAFDGAMRKESEAALYYAMLRSELTRRYPDSVDRLVVAVEAGHPLTRPQRAMLVRTVEGIAAALVQRFGTVHRTYGDLHLVGRGNVALPAGGASLLGGFKLPDHSSTTIEGRRYALLDTIRMMIYGADRRSWTEAARQRGGQRIPFVVAFSKQVQSFAALLPGESDDPASPHFSDQAQLASDRALRPTYLAVSDLLQNAESMMTLKTTGAP